MKNGDVRIWAEIVTFYQTWIVVCFAIGCTLQVEFSGVRTGVFVAFLCENWCECCENDKQHLIISFVVEIDIQVLLFGLSILLKKYYDNNKIISISI